MPGLPSIGGWGPREGVTAWAFGSVGLGAGRGLETAVVYGLLVLVATLPGAVVLAVSWCRRVPISERKVRPSGRTEGASERVEQPLAEGAAHA